MKIITLLLFVMSFNCYAIENIEESAVLEFLANEKSFIQNKDIEGLLSLLSEDFISTTKDGKSYNKSDFKIGAMTYFMNASKLLHNSKIKSLSISKDRKSAEVILDNETKSLIEINDYRRVISNIGTTKSLLIIDNGNLKYKKNQHLSTNE